MNFESHNKFFLRIAQGDEYAAVISIASYFDNYLEKIIKFYLIDCSSTLALFGGARPLSSFSAKINFAQALGLIDGDLHRKLDILRRIRNEFAHQWDDASLLKESNRVREFCGEIDKNNDLKIQFINTSLKVATDLIMLFYTMEVKGLRLRPLMLEMPR
jgi:hypothetical protein